MPSASTCSVGRKLGYRGVASVLGMLLTHLRGSTTSVGLPWRCLVTCRGFLVRLQLPSLPFFRVFILQETSLRLSSRDPVRASCTTVALRQSQFGNASYRSVTTMITSSYLHACPSQSFFRELKTRCWGWFPSRSSSHLASLGGDSFPSRISFPTLSSRDDVRTDSSACFGIFLGSLIGMDGSVPLDVMGLVFYVSILSVFISVCFCCGLEMVGSCPTRRPTSFVVVLVSFLCARRVAHLHG